MLYEDEVTETSRFSEIRDLPEAGDEELTLFTQIVDKLTVDLDLSVFHNDHKERIEALIKSRMKGESGAGGGKGTKEAGGQEYEGYAEGDGEHMGMNTPGSGTPT